MQVFNAKTQQLEDVTWSVDKNGEVVCTFADGHFYKFPAGSSKAEIEEYVAKHEQQNAGQVVITPEMEAAQAEADAAAKALIDELNA